MVWREPFDRGSLSFSEEGDSYGKEAKFLFWGQIKKGYEKV